MTAPAADPPGSREKIPPADSVAMVPVASGALPAEEPKAVVLTIFDSPAPAPAAMAAPVAMAGGMAAPVVVLVDELELAPVPSPTGLGPATTGPLPGEPGNRPDTSIPPSGRRQKGKEAAELPAKPAAQPKLAKPQVWPMSEEIAGRAWIGTAVLLICLGLYSHMLSSFYAGAHGGVDQAGYLMTARLIAGEVNPDNPKTVPRPTPPLRDGQPMALDLGDNSVWNGGSTGYTGYQVHSFNITGHEDKEESLRRLLETETPEAAARALGLPAPPTTTIPSNAFGEKLLTEVKKLKWGDLGEPFAYQGATVMLYLDENSMHPAPEPIQIDPQWDWIRNRLSFIPESPFQFTSRMCVVTEPFGPAIPDTVSGSSITLGKPAEYRVYAKYPFGFSLLAALGRDIAAHFDHPQVITRTPAAKGKPATVTTADAVGAGIDGMYIINPLCTVLACFFAYYLYRQAVSPFASIIGVLWLAFNPLVLNYSNDANSHASTLFCVCLGFWGVVSFLRTQQMWRAWIGGFALGYACTIRYSEFLLVLPVMFAAGVHFRPTWRRALGSLSLVIAWAIPVATLAFICWVSFGSPTKTGYTYCNEDTGFGWKYLSGDWGGGHVTEGNWENLLLSVNRTGLFLLWSMAIAGLFGMIGSAWRLGGMLALWVFPSMVLYMLYYWAPTNEIGTGYLRFFATIIPGMIFASVWVLERALATIKGEKWAGLTLGTLLGIVILCVLAVRADGGPKVLDGGVGRTISGFATQMPGAIWGLLTQNKLGALAGFGVIGAVACMWIFDRKLIAGRMGLALGAGAITALGCAVNTYTILPTIEASHARWTILRNVVDNMQDVLPRGSVIFCDDNLLQQLDCIGGWKLYNVSLFNQSMYNQARNRLEQSNTALSADDPNPQEIERSRLTLELLLHSSTTGNGMTLGQRTEQEINALMKAVVEKNIDEGHRVTFLALLDPGDMGGGGGAGGGGGGGGGGGPGGMGGRIGRPLIDGFDTRELRRFTVAPPPRNAPDATAAGPMPGPPVGPPIGPPPGGPGGRGPRGGRGGRGRGGPAGGTGQGILPLETPTPVQAQPPQGPTYVIYELVKRGSV